MTTQHGPLATIRQSCSLVLLLCLAASTAAAEYRPLPSNEAVKALLAERMAHNGVGVVVGIIEPAGRRVVAHGRSGGPDGRPLDGDTVFQIGSVTKALTGLLLAEMVQQGEVAFDDNASRYMPRGAKLPTFSEAPASSPITLLHLASHFSGLPSMPDNFVLSARPDPVAGYSERELFTFLSGYRLTRAPGTRGEYSNVGVALLGHLLARRAGMSYEALLRQRVLRPLGMSDTAITVDRGMAARLAPGHNRYLQPVDTWEMRTMPASGSLRSTANDMLRLLAAYLRPQSVPLTEALELALSTRSPAGSQGALGLTCRMIEGQDICYKDGGKAGYRSAMAFVPASGTGIVVLANARTDDSPQALALHLLAGTKLDPAPVAPAPRKSATVPRAELDRFAGRYEMPGGEVMTVVRNGSRLIVELDGSGPLEFAAEGAREFYLTSGNDALTFKPDAEGRVGELEHFPDGRDAEARQTGKRIQVRASRTDSYSRRTADSGPRSRATRHR